jgi:methylenetetrahydrofolate dehydrogenase (NADP+)/methenyltetrahydrofolate cyclohydrolase
MKVLNGSELAGFIKERQARQVRSLRQSRNVFPKLAIVCTDNNPVTETYLRLKKSYGEDILVDVEVSRPNDEELLAKIDELNNDLKIQGIIIQLPLADPNLTERALSKINPKKDVDALNPVTTQFTSATAKAIDWLLGGYNVDLNYKKIVIVGQGRLVGAPLLNYGELLVMT